MTHGLDDVVLVLRVDQFHDAGLKIIQIQRILRRSPRQDVVLVVQARRCQLLRAIKLDIYTILLHDSLNTPPPNAYNSFVIDFRYVEADLGWKFFLEEGKTMDRPGVRPGNIDEEIMFVEGLKFDFDIGRGHNLVDLPVLLPTDEFAIFIGQFELKSNLVMEILHHQIR
jgi:hypothetical protein